jgi:hypothetical protein
VNAPDCLLSFGFSMPQNSQLPAQKNRAGEEPKEWASTAIFAHLPSRGVPKNSVFLGRCWIFPRPTASPGDGPLSCRLARFRSGAAPEADLLGETGAPRRTVWRGQWISYRQVPAAAIIGDVETVRDPQMPAERLRTKPALETNHIFLLYRASDRHRRCRRLLHPCSTPETGEGAMHLYNQSGELVGRDLVMPYIAADDLRDPSGTDAQR